MVHVVLRVDTRTHYCLQNVGLGSEVIKVDASDADSGSNGVVTFRLVNTGGVNSPFLISPISGSLSVEQPLDRETIPQYTVSSSDECCYIDQKLIRKLLVTPNINTRPADPYRKF